MSTALVVRFHAQAPPSGRFVAPLTAAVRLCCPRWTSLPSTTASYRPPAAAPISASVRPAARAAATASASSSRAAASWPAAARTLRTADRTRVRDGSLTHLLDLDCLLAHDQAPEEPCVAAVLGVPDRVVSVVVAEGAVVAVDVWGVLVVGDMAAGVEVAQLGPGIVLACRVEQVERRLGRVPRLPARQMLPVSEPGPLPRPPLKGEPLVPVDGVVLDPFGCEPAE